MTADTKPDHQSTTKPAPQLFAGLIGLLCLSVGNIFPSHAATHQIIVLIGFVLLAVRNYGSYLFASSVLVPITLALFYLHPVKGWAMVLLILPVTLLTIILYLREKQRQRNNMPTEHDVTIGNIS